MHKLTLLLLPLFLASCGYTPGSNTDVQQIKNLLNPEIMEVKITSKSLPSTEDPLVLRTDFSDEKEWKKICLEILTPEPELGFLPHVVFASNPDFQDYTEEQLSSDSTSAYDHDFIFIVDKITITSPEHPIRCVGLNHNNGLKFRTIPAEMWAIENNLSIFNMDFEDFSTAVDEDGVYRGGK